MQNISVIEIFVALVLVTITICVVIGPEIKRQPVKTECYKGHMYVIDPQEVRWPQRTSQGNRVVAC